MSFSNPAEHLSQKVPNAMLVETELAKTNGLLLYLINQDYPQDQLSAEQVEDLMDDPPYWAFCWASGWVLAQCFTRSPQWVIDKTLVDFGCGSGVAGIAALKNGAEHVMFCDTDQAALAMTQRNLELNHIAPQRYTLYDDYAAIPKRHVGILLVADVFYDRENLKLLEQFQADADQVIVADSRLKGQALEGLNVIEHWQASTIPDLNESTDFRTVAIYRSV